ncbi:hypothetical protein [Paenibacillus sp. RUD330]|uniref:hypothetical protein n=1 Tax=Paenibacillus sp. RUD330 TaxID=2023772 RepID=UPI000B92B7EE|nr:hypothetical protein [Paenibacillus sp. RUD330]ASS64702.1 hypothetical protein CIC07_00205 [Paenibacillus sp. RUD330]
MIEAVAEFLGFMFFGSIEGFALIALVLALYRFKISESYWPVGITVFLMTLQSFLLREELQIAVLVPIVNAIFISLMLTIFLKVPAHWALFVSLAGYVGYIIFQIVISTASFGVFSQAAVEESLFKGYLLQLLTAAPVYYISRYLYSRGLGFSFDFDEKRLKHEGTVIVISVIIVLVSFGFVLYSRDRFLMLVVLLAAMAFFLYYSIIRERKE